MRAFVEDDDKALQPGYFEYFRYFATYKPYIYKALRISVNEVGRDHGIPIAVLCFGFFRYFATKVQYAHKL